VPRAGPHPLNDCVNELTFLSVASVDEPPGNFGLFGARFATCLCCALSRHSQLSVYQVVRRMGKLGWFQAGPPGVDPPTNGPARAHPARAGSPRRVAPSPVWVSGRLPLRFPHRGTQASVEDPGSAHASAGSLPRQWLAPRADGSGAGDAEPWARPSEVCADQAHAGDEDGGAGPDLTGSSGRGPALSRGGDLDDRLRRVLDQAECSVTWTPTTRMGLPGPGDEHVGRLPMGQRLVLGVEGARRQPSRAR